MEQKSKFDKVMGAWDILVIAFGAMIGWGWVINSGDWITTAGFMGSIIAMLIGGVMVFFVGLTYAELTSAMPQCGGEHVFSYRAMGPTGSFVCTWMIILGYVATAAFEATALPTVITYLFPDFNQVYLYSIAGKDIYLTTIILGVGVAFEKDDDLIDKQINDFGDDVYKKMQGAVNMETGKMSFSGTTGSISQILSNNATFDGNFVVKAEVQEGTLFEANQRITKEKRLQTGFGG